MRERKSKVILIVILIFVISISIALLSFILSTPKKSLLNQKSKAYTENSIIMNNLSPNSAIAQNDATTNIDLYTKDYLYESDSQGIDAAQDFIDHNPDFDSSLFGKGDLKTQSISLLSANNPGNLRPLFPQNFSYIRNEQRVIDDNTDEFMKINNFQDNHAHYFFTQTLGGVEVLGGSVIVHVKDGKKIYAVTGDLVNNNAIENKNINHDQAKQTALETAQKDVDEIAPGADLEITQEKEYIVNKKFLGVTDENRNIPVLGVRLSPKNIVAPFDREYFVDLTSGNVEISQSFVYDALDRRIYKYVPPMEKDEYFCEDYGNINECREDCPNQMGKFCFGKSCCSLKNPDNVNVAYRNAYPIKKENDGKDISDPDAAKIYGWMKEYYDFWKKRFGREGLNNLTGSYTAVINYKNISFCPNAGFIFGINLNYLLFCDGTIDLGIVTHELSHGIVDYTTNFSSFTPQTLAIGESLADFFSTFFTNKWTIGDNSVVGIIRYLNDPSINPRGPDPDRLFSPNYDCNGERHINSGVITKMLYLLSEGGDFNGYTINKIGKNSKESKDKLSLIIYHTLTRYFLPLSNFRSFANALTNSCYELYYEDEKMQKTCESIQNAISAVEIDKQSLTSSHPSFCDKGIDKQLTPSPKWIFPPTPTAGPVSSENKVKVSVELDKSVSIPVAKVTVKLKGLSSQETFSYDFENVVSGNSGDYTHQFTDLRSEPYTISISYDQVNNSAVKSNFLLITQILTCGTKNSEPIETSNNTSEVSALAPIPGCFLIPGLDSEAKFNIILSAIPTRSFTPISPRPTTIPRCIDTCTYRDESGENKCYQGNCLDPSKPCSNGINCGKVDICFQNNPENNMEVPCSDSPFEPTFTPTPTLISPDQPNEN